MAFDAALPSILDRDPLKLETPAERLDYLIAFLEQLPDERFGMDYFAVNKATGHANYDVPVNAVKHDCDTAACICGWLNALFGGDKVEDADYAAEVLDLDYFAAHRLFYAREWSDLSGVALHTVTKAQALAVLQRLDQTGQVSWDGVLRPDQRPLSPGFTVTNAVRDGNRVTFTLTPRTYRDD